MGGPPCPTKSLLYKESVHSASLALLTRFGSWELHGYEVKRSAA